MHVINDCMYQHIKQNLAKGIQGYSLITTHNGVSNTKENDKIAKKTLIL